MRRALFDGRSNLRDGVRRIGMRRVEQTGDGRQFRLRNRGVPETPGAKSYLRIVRETPLQRIDINRGVEEEFGEWRLEAGEESQLGAVAVRESHFALLRLQPPKRLLE
jgi:hypothetical protein